MYLRAQRLFCYWTEGKCFKGKWICCNFSTIFVCAFNLNIANIFIPLFFFFLLMSNLPASKLKEKKKKNYLVNAGVCSCPLWTGEPFLYLECICSCFALGSPQPSAAHFLARFRHTCVKLGFWLNSTFNESYWKYKRVKGDQNVQTRWRLRQPVNSWFLGMEKGDQGSSNYAGYPYLVLF